jgi:hypothetical protein
MLVTTKSQRQSGESTDQGITRSRRPGALVMTVWRKLGQALTPRRSRIHTRDQDRHNSSTHASGMLVASDITHDPHYMQF